MAKISKDSPMFVTIDEAAGGPSAPEGPCGRLEISGVETITHIPNIDMFSTPDELVIEVELPGVKRQAVTLSLHKNSLRLTALKFECFEEDKINYVCMERVFGRIYRSIEIPLPVDTSRIKALYKKGVLIITMPRIEDKRSYSRKVEIEQS